MMPPNTHAVATAVSRAAPPIWPALTQLSRNVVPANAPNASDAGLTRLGGAWSVRLAWEACGNGSLWRAGVAVMLIDLMSEVERLAFLAAAGWIAVVGAAMVTRLGMGGSEEPVDGFVAAVGVVAESAVEEGEGLPVAVAGVLHGAEDDDVSPAVRCCRTVHSRWASAPGTTGRWWLP